VVPLLLFTLEKKEERKGGEKKSERERERGSHKSDVAYDSERAS